jgi:hypothetical protein
MLCTIQIFGLSVAIKNILDAPPGPYGAIFGYDDRLEYLDNGALVYMGTYPPNLYTVADDRYVKLIEKYRNPIYDTNDPDRVVTRLLRSRVQGEWLYFARTRGAEQENYKLFPKAGGGASVESVSKEYLENNAERRGPTPEDSALREKYYSLGDGYFLDPQESKIIEGGLNVVIRKTNSDSVFVLDEAFLVGFIEHLGHVAISPEKNRVAMIVSYHEKETGRSVNRLVVLKLEYDDASSGGARQN